MLAMTHEKELKKGSSFRRNDQEYSQSNRSGRQHQNQNRNQHPQEYQYQHRHQRHHDLKRESNLSNKTRPFTPVKRRRINFDRRQNYRNGNKIISPSEKSVSRSKYDSPHQAVSLSKHHPECNTSPFQNSNRKLSSNMCNIRDEKPDSVTTYRNRDDFNDSYLPSFSSEKPSNKSKANNVTDLPQLDPNNSDQAHKIIKRRKMISYGKNTVGYDEYLKQVPKHKRVPRSTKHPQTPDPTIDIPWKRYHGLVKAWRKSLHMYDPVDLLPENNTVQSCPSKTIPSNGNKIGPSPPQSIQDSEIQQATQLGLQVQFSTSNNTDISLLHGPPSTSASMAGELNRLEIHIQEKEKVQHEDKPRYTWYQSSDDESHDRMEIDVDDNNTDEDSDDEIL